MNRWKYGVAALGVMGTTFFSPVAQAAAYIDIDLNGSFLFEGEMPITNIAIANPEIADIVRPSGFDSQVLLVGIAPGSTTLFVWYENGMMEDYVINVGIDDTGQARAIQRAIGLPRVQVQVVSGEKGKRRVLLRGTVKNQAEHDMAIKIASLYTGDAEKEDATGGSSSSSTDDMTSDSEFEYNFDYRSDRVYANIVDLLTVENPTQIRLEAQLVEILSDDAASLGFKYGGVDGDGGITFSNQFFGGQSFQNAHDFNYKWANYISNINASLNLLVQKGTAKVLSRPSVSTMSGAKAKIFIGGQFPVPVTNGNGSESIKWKDYGIRLNIRPTVDEDGSITAEVHAGVSRIDTTNTIMTSSTQVPSVTTREAHSIVHLDNGATMVVGGLLNSEDVKTVSKIPLLSAIPILGEFFKHTESSTERRELIILITPVVVDENTPARMSDKMHDYYNKGQEQEKARKDVDLNADRKAAEEKAAEEKARKEQEAVEAEWRARENNVPRVRPGNAWKRVDFPPDEEPIDPVAAEAGEKPVANQEPIATDEPTTQEEAAATEETVAVETPETAEEQKNIASNLNAKGNRPRTKAKMEEYARASSERAAEVNKWRESGGSSVRPGNAWARVSFPPDEEEKGSSESKNPEQPDEQK